MRKKLLIILSVTIMGITGCGNTTDNSEYKTTTETTAKGESQSKDSKVKKRNTVDMNGTADPTMTDNSKNSSRRKSPKLTAGVNTSDKGEEKEAGPISEEPVNISEEPVGEESIESKPEAADVSEEDSTDTTTETTVSDTPDIEAQVTEEPKRQTVSYNPDNVVSLAVSLCEASGMITTEHNLDNNFAAGKITQDEYNEYYPLDGLEGSYFSVFVNVDLNKAATTSGSPLTSENAIAVYVSDLLLLESDSIFNIRYTGIYDTGGESFYEFRCYR